MERNSGLGFSLRLAVPAVQIVERRLRRDNEGYYGEENIEMQLYQVFIYVSKGENSAKSATANGMAD